MYYSAYSAVEDADLFVCFLVEGQGKNAFEAAHGLVGAESEKGGEPSVSNVR